MAFLVPGQGFKDFVVYEKTGTISSSGSVGRSVNFIKKADLKGITTSMSPKERETWKQSGYEVSDKIVQYGSPKAKKGQYIVYYDFNKQSHVYEVKGVRNPGGLNHFSIYLVNERSDLQYFNNLQQELINYQASQLNETEVIKLEVKE